MNRIILIGNGFDLAHGLKTSYKDFIEDYWEGFMNYCINQDSYFSTGKYKFNDIELKMPEDLLLSNFLPKNEKKYIVPNILPVSYNVFMEFVSEFNHKYQDSAVGEIQFNINNKFLNHLLDVSQGCTSWVDIENEYYKCLTFKFCESKLERYEYNSIYQLNSDFDLIRNKLTEYLKLLQSQTDIQISSKIWDIIYSRYYVDEFTERAKDDIILNQIELVNKYKEDVASYKISPNRDLERLCNEPNIYELLQLKSLDRDFWNKFFDLKPKDCMFLNFNYTNTPNQYIDLAKKEINGYIPLTINIHGELKDSNNPIIFGYGDELEENYNKLESLQDNAYLENIKSINYQETDNYKRMLNFINSDNYQVIILGHSCGNSDRTLLNTLFEHENCVSIKPYYYQYKDEKTGEIKDNYSDLVRNISRNFKDKMSMWDKVVNKKYTTWFSEKL